MNPVTKALRKFCVKLQNVLKDFWPDPQRDTLGTEEGNTVNTKDDLPWQMRMKFNNQLNTVDLYTLNNTHTNIPKIREGRQAAQFWAAYVPCETQYKDAARQILQQIDVIHRMCMKYPEAFMFATSSKDIMDAFSQNRTARQIGVEGGHSLDSSLGTLRTKYHSGVRYLTLTHSCNTPWADNWLVDSGAKSSQHNGLSEFGKQLIFEMNRIGMWIDLAHVSEKVMNQVLDLSKAPVIFSHSSAYAVCPHKRNVPDDVPRKVVSERGEGVSEFLEDVSKDPALVAELLSVFREVEHVEAAR
ncbi:dipeptidase 1-like [Salvelinus fontinalis]|uniref:dipeptidase 1-like n=1 Tax=Salvelinus fontinalis TaxID=8038 RepID=UPI0024867D0B|nr:dipeptidase 1-like [Salvelinus fontinalis]